MFHSARALLRDNRKFFGDLAAGSLWFNFSYVDTAAILGGGVIFGCLYLFLAMD